MAQVWIFSYGGGGGGGRGGGQIVLRAWVVSVPGRLGGFWASGVTTLNDSKPQNLKQMHL